MELLTSLTEQTKRLEGDLKRLAQIKERLRPLQPLAVRSRPQRSEWEALEIDPCPHKYQQRMLFFYDNFDSPSLAYAIYLNALEEQAVEVRAGIPDKSWDKVINDYKRGTESRVLYYLLSLPDEVIRAFIKGNMPSQYQNASFRQRYSQSLALDRTQGTYVVYVGVRHKDVPVGHDPADPRLQRQTGYSLTLMELITLVDDMQLYITTDGNLSASSRELAKKVDQKFPWKLPRGFDYNEQRRYASGSNYDNFIRIEQFIETLTNLYGLQRLRAYTSTHQEYLLNRRLERCPNYVGLASNCMSRTTNHWTHEGTESPLYGLVTAMLEYRHPGEFAVEHFTFQVIRTVQVSDIGIDEILTSCLCSAYPWNGGLSAAHAGQQLGGKSDKSNPTYLQKLKDNASNCQTYHPQHVQSSAEKLKNMRDLATFMAEDEDGIAHEEASRDELNQWLENTKEYVDELIVTTQATLDEAKLEEVNFIASRLGL
ncbi:hypothetical protein LTR70_000523 [Exophiala xenobiotica]|uniref:Uncharacterized protein n=1 Tax=Lithohypha guttulata TaxID=1690604 RepID=A0ABR0KBF1_9EURO|nr:hypothetical protein LTR24_004669 [Lithohypha guttulata]KAK5329374.1 hypothetical protein LTR70_000523 [Exophiala xenobiotica]